MPAMGAMTCPTKAWCTIKALAPAAMLPSMAAWRHCKRWRYVAHHRCLHLQSVGAVIFKSIAEESLLRNSSKSVSATESKPIVVAFIGAILNEDNLVDFAAGLVVGLHNVAFDGAQFHLIHFPLGSPVAGGWPGFPIARKNSQLLQAGR